MKRTPIAIAATAFLLALITGSLAQTESFTNFVSGAPVGLPTSTDIIPCIESNGATNVTRQCTPPSLFTLITGAQIETSLGYAPLNPANNLSDVSNSSTARTNLGVPGGLGTALLVANNLSDVANTSTSRANLGVLAKANNLSDVVSTSTSRTNLGVLALANNLSDVASTSTSRTNLGVPFGLGTALLAANNLSDVSNTSTSRTNLGAVSGFNGFSTNQNILQNGDMFFDQRNEGGSVTIASGGGNILTVDRWIGSSSLASGAGNPIVQQQTASSGAPTQFSKSILVTASITAATGAADSFYLLQRIEGADVADLAFGTSTPAIVTASFWAKTSIANAVFAFTALNGSDNRSYISNINFGAANTWTYFAFTLSGDTTGTWNKAVGTIGFDFLISLTAGSSQQGTAGVWSAGAKRATSLQTQFTNSASATFEITGVRLERGAVATPFWSTPTWRDFLTLKRYYWKTFPPGTAPAQNTGSVIGAITVKNPIALGDPSIWVPFNPPMYASPTVTTYNPSASNANWRDITAGADATVSVDPATTKGTTGVLIATSGTVTTLGDVLAIHATFGSGL